MSAMLVVAALLTGILKAIVREAWPLPKGRPPLSSVASRKPPPNDKNWSKNKRIFTFLDFFAILGSTSPGIAADAGPVTHDLFKHDDIQIEVLSQGKRADDCHAAIARQIRRRLSSHV